MQVLQNNVVIQQPQQPQEPQYPLLICNAHVFKGMNVQITLKGEKYVRLLLAIQ